MPPPVRNRIKAQRRVRAGDLISHEFNFRQHPDIQRAAIEALYAEVGFARCLLAYELPDGRLKLLDGHLRRELDPDMQVEVEILDVNDDEARTLLLSIDPLASLAHTQEQLLDRLPDLTPTSNADLQAAWEAANHPQLAKLTAPPPPGFQEIPKQWLVLVKCRDEKQQVELLERFQADGLECKALMS